MPVGQNVRQVLWMAGTTGGDDGDADRVRHCTGERDVIAASRSIGVDAREQDLAGTAAFGFSRPGHGIEIGRLPSTVRVYLPSAVVAPGVDGDHDALRSEDASSVGDQFGALHGGGLDRDLVGAGAQ